jgi:Secretion system C-terminal sorting domain
MKEKKSRILYSWLAATIYSSLIFAQPPDTLWSQSYGDGTSEVVKSVRPVLGGGFILTGATNEGPGAYASWIMRTSENGEEMWSLIDGGGLSDWGDYIEPTRDGGFIHCGSTLSFSHYNTWNAYVRKLDANGSVEWQRQIGTDHSDDNIECVREIPGDGYIAFGLVDWVLTLWRLGPQGQERWVNTLPNESVFETAYFVEPTVNGFLLAAKFPDHFAIIRTDLEGTVEWQYIFGLGGDARSVRYVPSVGIFACGDVRFGDGSLQDAWYVIRLDMDGNLVWADSIDYEWGQKAHDIWPTADGNLLVSGMTQYTGVGSYRWLVKYDYDGNQLWHYELPAGRAETCAQAIDGGYVFSGAESIYLSGSTDFRLFKLEPEVDIQLQAWTPVIPETGGWLRYGAQVSNMLIDPTPLDAWIVVTGPSGNRVPLNHFPITLQPGATFTEPQITVRVPAAAPDGEYTYEVHLGNATQALPPGHGGSRNMAVESFTFVKGNATSVDGFSDAAELAWPQLNDSWHPFTGKGNLLADQPEQLLELPKAFEMTAAFPNPFNALTTVTVALPEASDLTVTVFNTLGQQVAELANGRVNAGRQTFTFDASQLSSGIYFIQATVPGKLDAMQKVVLVK